MTKGSIPYLDSLIAQHNKFVKNRNHGRGNVEKRQLFVQTTTGSVYAVIGKGKERKKIRVIQSSGVLKPSTSKMSTHNAARETRLSSGSGGSSQYKKRNAVLKKTYQNSSRKKTLASEQKAHHQPGQTQSKDTAPNPSCQETVIPTMDLSKEVNPSDETLPSLHDPPPPEVMASLC
eukprot:CFRG2501T1